MHGIAPDVQFEHGAPCSTTSQRTFRARQTWHAFKALRLIGCPFALKPNFLAFRFEEGSAAIRGGSSPGEVMSAGMSCRAILIVASVRGNRPSLMRRCQRSDVHIYVIPSIRTNLGICRSWRIAMDLLRGEVRVSVGKG